MDKVTEEYVYEYWDCNFCNTKELRGDVETCPHCGNPRDKKVRFYLLKDREEIVEKDKEGRFTKGADWNCLFCNTYNQADVLECRSCGHTKNESDKNYFDVTKTTAADITFKQDSSREKLETLHSLKSEGAAKPEKKKSRAGIIAASIVGGGFALLSSAFLGLIVWVSMTHDVRFSVIEKNWERSIAVERYGEHIKEAWKGEEQGDHITMLSSVTEIRSYNRIQIGTKEESYTDTEKVRSGSREECETKYESTGSGAAKKTTTCKDVPEYTTRSVTKTRTVPVYREEPVYAEKIQYRARMYALIDPIVANGKNDAPFWPKLSTVDGRPDKEVSRKESYSLTLQKVDSAEGPDQGIIQLKNEEQYSRYRQGETYTFSVSNGGTILVKD